MSHRSLKRHRVENIEEKDASSSPSPTTISTASDDSSSPPVRHCCLICSILPGLSTINTCHQHGTLIRSNYQNEFILSDTNSSDSDDLSLISRCSSSSSSSLSTPNRNYLDESQRNDQSIFLSPDCSPQKSQSNSTMTFLSPMRSPNTEQFEVITSFSPRIFLDRIIYVKDESDNHLSIFD